MIYLGMAGLGLLYLVCKGLEGHVNDRTEII
jgi:hypothetical protein